jgi:hypothetical protein
MENLSWRLSLSGDRGMEAVSAWIASSKEAIFRVLSSAREWFEKTKCPQRSIDRAERAASF